MFREAGFVRKVIRNAQGRIRRLGFASSPGRPPHPHVRKGLKLVKFHVNELQSNAVVGPVKFPRSNFFNQPVPHIHEFGKTVRGRLRRGLKNYPERSFVYRPVKEEANKGTLGKQFRFFLALG